MCLFSTSSSFQKCLETKSVIDAFAQATIATTCLVILKQHGSKCREAARDVLVCVAGVDPSIVTSACAEMGVADHEKLSVLWRQEAQREEVSVEEWSRVELLGKKMKTLAEDKLENVARAAASALATWPLTDMDMDYESVLAPVEAAAEQVRCCDTFRSLESTLHTSAVPNDFASASGFDV